MYMCGHPLPHLPFSRVQLHCRFFSLHILRKPKGRQITRTFQSSRSTFIQARSRRQNILPFLQGAEMRLGWRNRKLVNSSEKVKISYVIQKLVFLTLPISHKFFCRNMSKNFLFPTRLMDGRGKVISELFFFSFFFSPAEARFDPRGNRISEEIFFPKKRGEMLRKEI